MATSLPGLIRQLRAETGLTQEQLSRNLNMTVRTVARWESGSHSPDLRAIASLCRSAVAAGKNQIAKDIAKTYETETISRVRSELRQSLSGCISAT